MLPLGCVSFLIVAICYNGKSISDASGSIWQSTARFSITWSLQGDRCCSSCFFSTETSMHWKCQVTAAARSPSIYSKLNIRQKSQHRIDCLWCIRCVSLILKFYLCLYFFLSNAAAFQSRSESLCGSHKPVPVEKFPSWINLYCFPFWLQPVQKAFSGMVCWGYTQPSLLSSLLMFSVLVSLTLWASEIS